MLINYNKYRIIAASLAAVMILASSGCAGQETAAPTEVPTTEQIVEIETESVMSQLETMMPLTPDGPLLPSVEGLEAEYQEPAPEYLRLGEQHPVVAELQERLMYLKFMDNDEPTDYFGEMTQQAVKTYQRQNGLAQDGIVGPDTLLSIMSPEAKNYAAKNGDSGEDIRRIQHRLYELGYLAADNLVTGTFGDTTEDAVKKLQNVNSLEEDGKVGYKTIELLYSDEVKANMLAYGEKSDVVLAAQQQLKKLGYMFSEPDGTYGSDTIMAVKQFQSRNDQVVDGYLGPSTRFALNDSQAVPNGLRLGDNGEQVEKVQKKLKELGYLKSASADGYFGEKTEQAVKLFQSTNKLSSDGSVGVQTMAMLSSDSVKKAPAGSGSSGSSGNNSGSSGNNNNNSGSGSTGGTPNTGSAPAGSGASALIAVASSKVGRPYVYGAKGPNSFDCSGFVYWCLNQVGVRQSYLTSSGWRSVGKYTKITNFSSLQPGDIIVVSGHVGIVAGGGTVIDASSSNGKVVHRSLSSWWSRNFICGWRIF